ncbi:DMT family transporter [Bacillus sp. Brlt_9]|uniref:DMT family transporter n=1 Tax=Bacillus sp. Brlt_9 TaxID=3110916 RepID=UPI003F7BB68A
MLTQKQANLILITVSMGWGTSYIFMKLCADAIAPFTMVTLRFGIACIVMVTIFYKQVMNVDIKTLKYSAIVGALLCGIFIALSYGIKTTTASSAGFLTSTTVILLPMLQTFITRRAPERNILLGVMIVCIGLALLTIKDELSFATGSLYCLTAAFLYAIYIVVTDHFAREVSVLNLGIFQLGFATVYASIGIFIFETPTVPEGGMNWFAILGLAFICSAYGFVMQPIAQKYTTPESTGFIFSLEPIFSAIFAFIFLHENMGLQGYVGASVILIGVFVANRTPKKENEILNY